MKAVSSEFGLRLYVAKEGTGWRVHAVERAKVEELTTSPKTIPEKPKNLTKVSTAAALAFIAGRMRFHQKASKIPDREFSDPVIRGSRVTAPVILSTKFTKTWPSTLSDRIMEQGIVALLRDFGNDALKLLLRISGRVAGNRGSQGRLPGSLRLGVNPEILLLENIRVYEITKYGARLCDDLPALDKLMNGIQSETNRRATPKDQWRSLRFNSTTGEATIATAYTRTNTLDGIGSLTSHPSEPQQLRGGEMLALDHPMNKLQESYLKEIQAEIDALFKDSRIQAERQARQNASNTLGAITECFGASSSYLFVRKWEKGSKDSKLWIEEDSPIVLCLDHNTGIKEYSDLPTSAKVAGEGIIGHVARTRRPYLANQVKYEGTISDPFYKDSVSSTMSEVAVPLFHTDVEGKKHVIGVLNLESEQAYAFSEAQQGDLMAAATKLTMDILVIHHLETHLDAFGWHPDVTGWTLDRLLDSVCAIVAGSREKRARRVNQLGLLRPSCTVWFSDSDGGPKDLYVRGTARIDYEYLSTRSLAIEKSFAGLALKYPEGAVLYGPVEKLGTFARKEKSKQMGIAYAFATPFSARELTGSHDITGTVTLYLFKEELPKSVRDDITQLDRTIRARFPRQLAVDIAKQVGNLISDFRSLKTECASAYLRHCLHQYALPGLTDFDTAKEVFLRCLDAHYCSIFARERHSMSKGGFLRCVSSTGLRTENSSSIDPTEAVYDLDDPNQRGVSSYLASGDAPDGILRLRSVGASLTPQPGEPLPLNKYLETFSHSDTEHRPFLGVAVSSHSIQASRPVGIIRILRKSGSKRFVKSDGLVLKRLAYEIQPLFLDWEARRRTDAQDYFLQCGARFPFALRVIGQTPTLMKVEAIDRLGRALPIGAIWNYRQIESVLMDLLEIYRKDSRESKVYGGLITSFRVACHPSAKTPYKIIATHRLLSGDPPSPEEVKKHEERGTKTIGGMSVDQMSPITFDPHSCDIFRSLVPESQQVASGVCMPTRILAPSGEIRGVVSVDCDDKALNEWRSEHLEVAALAARQLEFVGRNNCFEDKAIYDCEHWTEGLRLFLKQTLGATGVRVATVFQQYTARPARDKVLSTRDKVFSEEPNRWTTKTRVFKYEQLDSEALTEATRDLDCNPFNMLSIQQIRQPRPLGPVNDVMCNRQGGFQLALWYSGFDTGLTLKGQLANTVCAKSDEGMYLYFDLMRNTIAEIGQLWNRFTNSHIGSYGKPLFRLSFQEDLVPVYPKRGLTFWKPVLEMVPDIFGIRH